VDPTEKALPFPRNVWNAKRSIVATEIAKQFPSILGKKPLVFFRKMESYTFHTIKKTRNAENLNIMNYY